MRLPILSQSKAEPLGAERPGAAAAGTTEGSAECLSGTATGGAWLSRLTMTNFRNYRAAEMEMDGRPLVLTGPNGAGKTNLLEAVSLLTPGRGLRRAGLADLERRGPRNDAGGPDAGWAVSGRVVTSDGPRTVGTGRAPEASEGARERRAVKVDGDFVSSQQALSQILAAVWLTPQMDSLFREAPSGRRRFLDRLVYAFDPAHAGRVSAYERAMRERARLLKGERGPPDPAWLNALESTMAERAVAIAAARREMTARLARACEAGVGPFPRAALGLDGDVETWLGEMPALDAEAALTDALREGRARDGETGGASVGAHRLDLVVRHVERDMPAELCSTGEQKALLICIVLAHARLIGLARGGAPLLLLDEIAAHLDEERRRALFGEILALGAQAWLTGTDRPLFEGLTGQAQFFEVRDAQITRAE